MMKNDELGDCVIAGYAHQVMNWRAVAAAGSHVTITDDEVIAAYSAVGGYVPGDSSTDNGCNMLDALHYWLRTGIQGHKPQTFATIDVQNLDQVKAAIYLFGGLYIGFQVPQFIMDTKLWAPQQDNAQIIGGHCVDLFGYGRSGAAVCTWGEVDYHMTWDFFLQYVDEAYALVSTDWIKASGLSPTGLDLDGMLKDLNSI
jgi:hypothetical protein